MMDAVRERLQESNRNRKKKMLLGIIAVIILVIVSVMLEKQINSKPKDVLINKEEISETAKFISLKPLDTNIIAVKAADGSYRLAFDDCEGCYVQFGVHSKYKINFDNTGLVCKKCKHEVSYEDMAFSEECKPVPIHTAEIIQEEDKFIIPSEYLERKKQELDGMREGKLMEGYKENTNR